MIAMRQRFGALLALWLVVTASLSQAAEDQRVRLVSYDAKKVVPILVKPRFAVHVSFSPSEEIVAAGTGLSSQCDDPAAGWCVVAVKGTSDLYVNAHENAERTNLFVKTNKRNYSFDLRTLGGRNQRKQEGFYRVEFSYPDDIRLEQEQISIARQKLSQESEKQRLLAMPLTKAIEPINWNYTQQTLPGSDEIVPTKMYDDGRFTYITFNSREFPSIFKVSDNDGESLVQYHVEEGNVMVVHQVAKRFVLRAGEAVVGLWNETYDSRSSPVSSGVTIPGVVRRLIRNGVEADVKDSDLTMGQSENASNGALVLHVAPEYHGAGNERQ